jgi:hypothetical protein
VVVATAVALALAEVQSWAEAQQVGVRELAEIQEQEQVPVGVRQPGGQGGMVVQILRMKVGLRTSSVMKSATARVQPSDTSLWILAS